MKRLSLLASGLWASLVAAAPLVERQSSTDIDPVVLNFALTLEHLENYFYKTALGNFTQADFEKAGYSATYYNNLKHIAYDEESHVKLLTAALQAAGVTPVAACQYTFPYTDVASFITLSSVIEGVGTSAYLGGAPLITDKGYLTVAGSILVTEALHTSYQRAAIGEVPYPSPYGTPLDPTSVFSIASAFIHDCPASNPALPFKPFPALTYDDTQNCRCEEPDCSPSAAIKRDVNSWGNWQSSSSVAPTSTTMATSTTSQCKAKYSSTSMTPAPTTTTMPMPPKDTSSVCSGSTVTVTVGSAQPTWSAWSGPGNGKGSGSKGCAPPSAGATVKFTAAKPIPAGSYVTFVSGLNVVSVQGSISGADISVAIPAVVAGQSYVFVTSADVEKTLDATKVLFGPAIVEVNPAAPTYDPSYIKV